MTAVILVGAATMLIIGGWITLRMWAPPADIENPDVRNIINTRKEGTRE